MKAIKRAYFFDVKATRVNDYFLTITESWKHPQGDRFTSEKRQLFLYEEDFDKLIEAPPQTVDHVKDELLPDVDFTQFAGSNREGIDGYASSALKWK